MKNAATPNARRSRTIAIGAGVVAVAAVLVVGLMSMNRTAPVRADLPAPTGQSPSDASQASAHPLSGKGTPLTLAGTDPVTGTAVSLAALRGKPVVVTIWASWCPGCNSEAPHLAKVMGARSDVHFLGINFRDDSSGARGFQTKHGIRLPSIADPSGDLAFSVGLQGTPTTLFLDADHREIGRVVGPMDGAGLNEAIDRITGA